MSVNLIWWSPGIHSEISVMLLSKSVYTSIDLRRERKHSVNLREMLETQGYEQAQDAEERRKKEAQSKRRYTF